jgi:hypothetical protein
MKRERGGKKKKVVYLLLLLLLLTFFHHYRSCFSKFMPLFLKIVQDTTTIFQKENAKKNFFEKKKTKKPLSKNKIK